jgi:hypothetical protein
VSEEEIRGRPWDPIPTYPLVTSSPGIGKRRVLEVDDCRKTFADLKGRGAKFVDPQPREEGWG